MQLVIVVEYLVIRDETSYLLGGLDLWVDEMDANFRKPEKCIQTLLAELKILKHTFILVLAQIIGFWFTTLNQILLFCYKNTSSYNLLRFQDDVCN